MIFKIISTQSARVWAFWPGACHFYFFLFLMPFCRSGHVISIFFNFTCPSLSDRGMSFLVFPISHAFLSIEACHFYFFQFHMPFFVRPEHVISCFLTFACQPSRPKHVISIFFNFTCPSCGPESPELARSRCHESIGGARSSPDHIVPISPNFTCI